MGRETTHFDWITALLLILLSSIGLFVLLTISQALFFQQLAFVAVGIALLFFFSRLDSVILWWAAPWCYVVSLLLLAISFLGPEIRGATRWIVIGGAQLQPSELVKPLFILSFAYFITRFPPRNARYILLHVSLFLLPAFMVFRQPDIGTTLIYSSFWIAMMLAGGLSIGILVVAIFAMTLLFPALWNWLAPYQRARILTFLQPNLDPSGAGYNALQSMIAVGSGQIFGRGLGRGTQSHLRFLPEHHTDFIFATLVEELGFFGGLVLLASYAGLLWRILQPLLRGTVNELFSFVFSVGLFATILSQLFINSGMNMGILPITGITLPFVSYGGSSILSLSIAFGIWWGLIRSRAGSVAFGPLH